jgi:hypothetical protein
VKSAGHAVVASPTLAGCNAETVNQVITDFLDAFNNGDRDRALRFIAAGRDGHLLQDPDRFHWYGMGTAGDPTGHIRTDDRADLVAYFAQRHAQHERLQLLGVTGQIDPASPSAALVIQVIRQADDLPTRTTTGKVGINCARRTIYLWHV